MIPCEWWTLVSSNSIDRKNSLSLSLSIEKCLCSYSGNAASSLTNANENTHWTWCISFFPAASSSFFHLSLSAHCFSSLFTWFHPTWAAEKASICFQWTTNGSLELTCSENTIVSSVCSYDSLCICECICSQVKHSRLNVFISWQDESIFTCTLGSIFSPTESSCRAVASNIQWNWCTHDDSDTCLNARGQRDRRRWEQ